MIPSRTPLARRATRARVVPLAIAAALAAAGALAPPRPALCAAPGPQGGAAPGGRNATIILRHALERISARTGVAVFCDSGLAGERVPAPPLAPAGAPEGVTNAAAPAAAASAPPPTPEAIAATVRALEEVVRALPPGTEWGQLYLPPPPPGRTWRGDDVVAFAVAQARLYGPVGGPVPGGGIEILGRRVAPEAAPAYVAALGLRPVFLVTNERMRRESADAMLSGAPPWSPLPEGQWAGMSRDERRAYGREQAERIMALPPEERQRVLDRIRQHDAYFESVKSPLEKLLGHDL